ncbi:MAG: DUF488 family protein [Syntrophomonadaceae bacterium]
MRIKRIYEEPGSQDGFRVLVDRFWPRGIRKDEARLDEWAKEIAPSNEIRKKFAHQPDRMAEFRKDYTEELRQNPYAPEFLANVREKLKHSDVTLVYAAKDERYNQAVILKEWLEEKQL